MAVSLERRVAPVISALLRLFTIISDEHSRREGGRGKEGSRQRQCNAFELKIFLTKKKKKKRACVGNTDNPMTKCTVSTLKNVTAAGAAGAAAREHVLGSSGKGRRRT